MLDTMHLYRLGRVSWQESQLAYHALAHLGREGLVLCSPERPYVSVGYSQDPAQELDLAYCAEAGLPVFRREVGGGAVYLDRHQLFWQVVLKRNHPLVSLNRQRFYNRLLAPVVAAYQDLGAPARVAPVNDVAVGGRRIAGTGAGEIGDSVAFVGNLMRRFDCAAMARVLRAPDEAFRRCFHGHMESQLTSLRRELGAKREAALDDEALYDCLAARFAEVLGPLEKRTVDDELRSAMERLGRRLLSPEWTYRRRKPRPHRKVKVRAGLFLHHWKGQSPEGHLEAQFTSQDHKVVELRLQGEAVDLQRLESRLLAEFMGRDARSLQKRLSSLAARAKAA
ncbi:MAG: lipoate--protein ligase family protein [Desulfarculaceae bacterium]|nr:lipoate--protein ligase family protein [Desulfarculaceae bacterium]MCF8071155.1 lipoate--protein ligase family protein [Desulfarculaceae bacterium]MCF8101242.1 lipoate--protein ligase family protein [Desulfarculaceae bacterium]MCF8115209.1 lipoate--protein ligase family protein [Desulfarculaceae bacterium]